MYLSLEIFFHDPSMMLFVNRFLLYLRLVMIVVDLLINVTENQFVFSLSLSLRVVYNYFVSFVKRIFSFLPCFCKEDINIKSIVILYRKYN